MGIQTWFEIRNFFRFLSKSVEKLCIVLYRYSFLWVLILENTREKKLNQSDITNFTSNLWWYLSKFHILKYSFFANFYILKNCYFVYFYIQELFYIYFFLLSFYMYSVLQVVFSTIRDFYFILACFT